MFLTLLVLPACFRRKIPVRVDEPSREDPRLLRPFHSGHRRAKSLNRQVQIFGNPQPGIWGTSPTPSQPVPVVKEPGQAHIDLIDLCRIQISRANVRISNSPLVHLGEPRRSQDECVAWSCGTVSGWCLTFAGQGRRSLFCSLSHFPIRSETCASYHVFFFFPIKCGNTHGSTGHEDSHKFLYFYFFCFRVRLVLEGSVFIPRQIER